MDTKRVSSGQHHMDRFSSNETFLDLDPLQMHKDACVENSEAIKNWEQYFRQELFPTQQYCLITRALHTYPTRKKTSVMISQTFPILKNATISTINPSFVPDRAKFNAPGNVKLQFVSTFETPSHGIVHLIGVSLTSLSQEGVHGRLEMGVIRSLDNTKPHELTFSMTNANEAHLEDIFLFFVTMIVPFTGCRCCGFAGEVTTTTKAKMPKCGRCWQKLYFPVWYCSKDCQVLDYQRHCKEDECLT